MKFETVFGLQRVVKRLQEKGLLYTDSTEITAAYKLAELLKDSRKFEVLKEWIRPETA